MAVVSVVKFLKVAWIIVNTKSLSCPAQYWIKIAGVQASLEKWQPKLASMVSRFPGKSEGETSDSWLGGFGQGKF